MTLKLLLKVEDTLLVEKFGLMLAPDLPWPAHGGFKTFQEKVAVHRPDGSTGEFEARFQSEHLHIVGGGTWNIVVIFTDATKEDVPIGSEVMVSDDALKRVRGGAV